MGVMSTQSNGGHVYPKQWGSCLPKAMGVTSGAHELPKAAKERWTTCNVRSIPHIWTRPYMEHRVRPSGWELINYCGLHAHPSGWELINYCGFSVFGHQMHAHTWLSMVYAVYTADTYLQYTYQITHAIQIRPGLPSWDVERTFRPYAEFDAPSKPSAAHVLLVTSIQTKWGSCQDHEIHIVSTTRCECIYPNTRPPPHYLPP